jgi:hypothetical protein
MPVVGQAAMSLLGLDGNMQDQIFSVLAAILHLGNIRFKDGSPLSFVEPQRSSPLLRHRCPCACMGALSVN